MYKIIKEKNIMCQECFGTEFIEGLVKEMQYYRCNNKTCEKHNCNVALSSLKQTYKVWKNGFEEGSK